MTPDKKTIACIQAKKQKKQKISMLTAYTFSLARFVDAAGIDIILVGDSVAQVEYGLDSTTDMTVEKMLSHAQAVQRAVKQALLAVDMPYGSFHVDPPQTLDNARRFIGEAGADAVKIEWHPDCLDHVKYLIRHKIPVMGHVGLTPQRAEQLGGYKVQGKDSHEASCIQQQACSLQDAGCFSVVIECVPAKLAQSITSQLTIPTIGIGAGIHCDGQVLVLHDMLGITTKFKPRFVKQYAELGAAIQQAAEAFKHDIDQQAFPEEKHSF